MVISIITEVAKALGVKTKEELNAVLKDIEIEPFTEKESTNDQEFAALLENIDFEHEIVDWSDTSVKKKNPSTSTCIVSSSITFSEGFDVQVSFLQNFLIYQRAYTVLLLCASLLGGFH